MMKDVFVPVGEYLVRLEKAPRGNRTYESSTFALRICLAFLVGVLSSRIADLLAR